MPRTLRNATRKTWEHLTPRGNAALSSTVSAMALLLGGAILPAHAQPLQTLDVSAAAPGESQTISTDFTYSSVRIGIDDAESGAVIVAPATTVTVESTGAVIGVNEGSVGTLSISGTGAVWHDVSGTFDIGSAGQGMVSVSDGGALNTINATFGVSASGFGMLTLSGATSVWNNQYDARIGLTGAGQVHISEGAQVNNGQTLFVTGTNTENTLIIEGDGTKWVNSGGGYVGTGGGFGTLIIRNGARFETVSGSISAGEGASVEISGAGTVVDIGTATTEPPVDWNAAQGYYTLNEGTTLLSGGATLIDDAGYLGGDGDTLAVMTVSGAGTLWRNDISMYVGGNGNGVVGYGLLTVADGATVTAYTAAVGVDTDSYGDLVLTGANALLRVDARTGFAGNMRVGFNGHGTALVENEAGLYATNLLEIASNGGSSGILTARNDATVHAGNNINIAPNEAGTGALIIQTGATVSTDADVNIANNDGGVGTLVFGSQSGEAPVAAGTLTASGTVKLGGEGATILFNHTNMDFSFDETIEGTQGAIQQLAGMTILTADSSNFTGMTTVSGGTLAVNGTLGGTVSVADGGTLRGSGTVGDVVLASGSTVAPGNSPGTLRVAGDITFNAGSTYEVELDAETQQIDLIAASGAATIDSASRLYVVDASAFEIDRTYTILTADAGVTGAFASVDVGQNMAFLTPAATYGPTSISLLLMRNDTAMESKAGTPNQRAAAYALDHTGSPIHDEIVRLPNDPALLQQTFSALSGDSQASTGSGLVEIGGQIRSLPLNRLRSAFGGLVAASSSNGETAALGFDTLDSPVAWFEAFGTDGHTDSDSNYARMNRKSAGSVVGIDAAVFDNVRLGLLAGYSESDFKTPERLAVSKVDSYHFGAYAGAERGAFALRGGASYTWHSVTSSRQVALPSAVQTLSADYDAGAMEIFAEAGYGIEAEFANFEPFANLAYMRMTTDAFTETGGSAALHSSETTSDTVFSTLGLRISRDVTVQERPVTLLGSIGWRHAFGDVDAESTLSFANGDAFTVIGTPIAEDVALVEAGFEIGVHDNARLGLAYTGQFGDGSQQQGINANLKINF